MYIDYYNMPEFAYLLAIACTAAGLAIAIGGYRFRCAAVCLSALFATGDYITTLLTAIDSELLVSASAYYLSFFVASIVFAAIAFKHTESGVVITGFCAGVHLMRMVLQMADYRGSIGLYFVLLTLSGLVAAPLTHFTKKCGFAVASSFVGTSVFMGGVSFFVNRNFAIDYDKALAAIVNTAFLSRSRRQTQRANARAKYNDSIESAWWTVTAIQLVLVVMAVALQLLLTARSIDHDIVQDETDLPVLETIVRKDPDATIGRQIIECWEPGRDHLSALYQQRCID